jgi:hypothetical protein
VGRSAQARLGTAAPSVDDVALLSKGRGRPGPVVATMVDPAPPLHVVRADVCEVIALPIGEPDGPGERADVTPVSVRGARDFIGIEYEPISAFE